MLSLREKGFLEPGPRPGTVCTRRHHNPDKLLKIDKGNIQRPGEKCGLGLAEQEGSVAAPLPRPAAVIDHPVGDKRVVAHGLPHLNVSLSPVAQNPVELIPAPGTERHALGSRLGISLTIVNVDLNGDVVVVDFPRVDQRQIAPVLLVLLQTIDPGTVD